MFSRLNAGHQLNTGLEKMLCQNCWFLNNDAWGVQFEPWQGYKHQLQVNIISSTAMKYKVVYSTLFWYFNKIMFLKGKIYHCNITRMDTAHQNVRYPNTVTMSNVHTVVILEVPGAGQRVKSSHLTNCSWVSEDQ